MVLVGGPAMVEAVQTTTSTFGIWAIVVVAMVCLAVWLVGVSVADNIQTRESRRWWRRLHALNRLWAAVNRLWAAPSSSGQRRSGGGSLRAAGNVRGAEWSAAGQEAADRQRAWASQEDADTQQRAWASQEAETEPIPAQGPTRSRSRSRRPPRRGDGTPSSRRSTAPATSGGTPPRRTGGRKRRRGRICRPRQRRPGRTRCQTQRTGDADRAERSLAGPDAARQDDDPEEQGRPGRPTRGRGGPPGRPGRRGGRRGCRRPARPPWPA